MTICNYIQVRALCILGKCSITILHSRPCMQHIQTQISCLPSPLQCWVYYVPSDPNFYKPNVNACICWSVGALGYFCV
jgi:hypothetical protein